MKEINLTIEELKQMYQNPPKDTESETDFQRHYRMGRNSMILELIEKYCIK